MAVTIRCIGRVRNRFHLVRSNHTDRTETYVRRNAPALYPAAWLQYPQVMGFDRATPLVGLHDPSCDAGLPITWEPCGFVFAKGWVLFHGDEGALSRLPAVTAVNLAKKVGANVVCGHTHRAGIGHFTTGHSGKITSRLVGMEVGHLMDMAKADYLKTGGAEWQQAFGVVRIRKGKVFPEVVMIHDGAFCVNGIVYRV